MTRTIKDINTGRQLRLNYELLLLSLAFEANEMPPEVDVLSDKDLMDNLNVYLNHFNCIPFTLLEVNTFLQLQGK